MNGGPKTGADIRPFRKTAWPFCDLVSLALQLSDETFSANRIVVGNVGANLQKVAPRRRRENEPPHPGVARRLAIIWRSSVNTSAAGMLGPLSSPILTASRKA